MTARSKITQQHDGFSHLFPSIRLYLFSMTETPEWFQLPDEPKSEPRKPKRITLKIALFTLPLLLVGGVMVFGENGAEGEDQPNLPTLNSTSTQSANTSTLKTSNAPVVTKKVTKKSTVSKKSNGITIANSSNSNATVPAPNGIKQSGNGIKNPGLPSKSDPDHGAGLDRHKRQGGQHEDHEGGQPNKAPGEDD